MLNNKQFKSLLENIQSREEIKKLLKKYKINNYVINDDDSVDVNGFVDDDSGGIDGVFLWRKGLTRIPINFRIVKGYFDCSGNQLTSLEGAPQKVTGQFDCSDNNLTSLEGSPQEVKGYFECGGNPLVNFKGVPRILTGKFLLYKSDWERLNPSKEVTLDDITDRYGEDECINVKDYLYKDNKLILK